jgi:hypothetical protein
MQNNKYLPALALLPFVLSGCGDDAVSYAKTIQPLASKYCGECHASDAGKGARQSGFKMDTYANLMKGTKYGPVIVAGDPDSSTFYRLVAGKVDPSIKMPHGKEALAAADIQAIENWIKQGAKNN